MLKNVFQTYSSSISNAAFSFLTTILLSRFLGAEGMADVGIFLFTVSLILIFAAVFGGTTIVYILPRHQFNSVFCISNCWAVICSLLSVVIAYLFQPNYPYFISLLFVCIIQSIYINLLSLSLARKHFANYNLIRVLQPILLTVGIFSSNYLASKFNIEIYFIILFCAYLIPTFLLLTQQSNDLFGQKFEFADFKSTILAFLKFGGLSQITNFLQLFNYRISYFFIAMFCNKDQIGVMVLAMTLVDGIWIFKNSISLLKYVDAANNIEGGLMRKEIKLSFVVTCGLMILVLIVPNDIYSYIFGGDFEKLKTTLILMSPGVLFMSASSIIANYFSGIGKVQINLFVAFVALVLLLPSTYLLSKHHGLYGAAVANNIPLVIGSLIVFYYYRRHLKTNPA